MESDSSWDFHIHSRYSYDSVCSTKDIIKTATKKGLTGIAVTDHNTLKGAVSAKKISGGLIVVTGAEMKTDRCEIIGLFLSEEIKSRRFEEAVDEIKAQDGLIVLPHPYKKGKDPFAGAVEKADAIEALNGRRDPELNRKAHELARNAGKPVTAGSDAHMAGEIGCVRSIYGPVSSEEELRKQILSKTGRVSGAESPGYVHYPSVFIGSVRTGNLLGLMKSAGRKVCSRCL
jgi:predicted metal-dependent phosphoesterase TrpH